MNTLTRGIASASALCIVLIFVGACHRTAPAEDAAPPEVAAESKDSPLTLTAEEQAKAGVTTTKAETGEGRQQVMGYGVVLSHDAIAQVVADVLQAEAVARQSKAALDRARRLAGTPGAISSDLQEAAARQAAVDDTAATLANQKLSAAIGQSPPWHNATERTRALRDIASGETKLLRVTFSLNDPRVGLPATFQLSRINRDAHASQWQSDTAWPAPADSAVPGYSYFALLHIPEVAEGEHLLASTASGENEHGFVIPGSAVVLYDGRSWFYLERTPGQFARVGLDTNKRIEIGYIATSGVNSGDQIVTSGAGLLLARETGTAEPD